MYWIFSPDVSALVCVGEVGGSRCRKSLCSHWHWTPHVGYLLADELTLTLRC